MVDIEKLRGLLAVALTPEELEGDMDAPATATLVRSLPALLDELERKTKALEEIELLATNHRGWLETDPRKLVGDIHAAASAALKGEG